MTDRVLLNKGKYIYERWVVLTHSRISTHEGAHVRDGRLVRVGRPRHNIERELVFVTSFPYVDKCARAHMSLESQWEWKYA